MIAGLMAAAVSATINVILFFIFKALGLITDDIFVQPYQPLTVIPVVFSSIFPTLIAAFVFFILEKYIKNGLGIFTILSIGLMLLSLVTPFVGIPNVTIKYALALEPMHFVVALTLLYFISRSKKSNG